MVVLMQNRPDAFKNYGGDTTQMLKTKEALEKLGVQVDVSLELEPRLAAYDIVHVFNVQIGAVPITFRQIINAKRQGLPVALSTIYWDMSEANAWHEQVMREIESSQATQELPNDTERHKPLFSHNPTISVNFQSWRGRDFVLRRLTRRFFGLDIIRVKDWETAVADLVKDTARMAWEQGWHRAQHQSRQEGALQYEITFQHEFISYQQLSCVLLADILLPNAWMELKKLQEDLKVTVRRARIVPNAVDSSFSSGNPQAFYKRYGLKDFVLCVGLICPVKNQLMLIRALKNTGVPLVLVGRALSEAYLKQCQAEADDNVLFLGEIAHEELPSVYAAAKVHALPSWRETPSLASLEAGLAGCNLVGTKKGTAEEYFGDRMWYCEPSSIESIREAVLAAYYAERRSDLAEHILSHFTWEHAGRETLSAYKELLSLTCQA